MDFFDKVANTTKELAKTVVDSAGDLVDKGKVKVNLVQAQGELRDRYREYGEFMYIAAKNGSCDESAKAALVAKIDETATKISNIEEEHRKAKAEVEKNVYTANSAENDEICPNCGTKRINKSTFCGNCGQKFQ